MIKSGEKVSVVYLAWLPYGIQHFQSFLKSYQQYEASFPHDLVIIFNGLAHEHPNPVAQYFELADSHGIKPARILEYQSGQDIDIYIQAARVLESDYILFLNTYSIIQAGHWLSNFVKNWHADTGMISASGSWQSYYSSVFQIHKFSKSKKESWQQYFRKIKLFIKAFLYWRFIFKPFPNPHLRTNAFFVNRTEFVGITNRFKIKNKFDAYSFESGRNGLSQLYLKRGKGIFVLDKYGVIHSMSDWNKSATFRISNQEALLVKDNQTNEYENADKLTKQFLSYLTWGKHA